jgi:hypothetical protein
MSNLTYNIVEEIIACSKTPKDYTNVTSSLCLVKHGAKKTHGGVDVELHAFLIWKLGGGKWSASLPGLTLGERDCSTHRFGQGGTKCWIGQDDEENRTQISCLSNPYPSLCTYSLNSRNDHINISCRHKPPHTDMWKAVTACKHMLENVHFFRPEQHLPNRMLYW